MHDVQPVLSVGYVGPFDNKILANIMRKFYNQYPLAKIDLFNSSFLIYDIIQKEQIDIIFGTNIALEYKERIFIPFRSIDFKMISAYNYDEMQKTFICPNVSKSKEQDVVIESLSKNYPDANILFSNNYDDLMMKVEMGEGIGILPDFSYIPNCNYKIKKIHIGSKVTYGISIKRRNKAIDCFYEIAKRIL